MTPQTAAFPKTRAEKRRTKVNHTQQWERKEKLLDGTN